MSLNKPRSKTAAHAQKGQATMLYPYQDKQTLCVTLEDPGKEAISDFALQAIVRFPLFPAALATLFSFLFILLAASDLEAPLFPPHAYLALATLPSCAQVSLPWPSST